MAKNFYDVLGVAKDASPEAIKKAYRKLARKWHPDMNPGNKESEQKFKEISAAYDCFGTKEKRKLYDEFGEDGLRQALIQKRPGTTPNRNPVRPGAPSGEGFGRYQSYEDIFGDMFGFAQGGPGVSGRRPPQGRDSEHELRLTCSLP